MKFSISGTLVLLLAGSQAVGASTWFSKAGKSFLWSLDSKHILTSTVYNKWHETELERWLSDHGRPSKTVQY